jgi:hypothetical protein
MMKYLVGFLFCALVPNLAMAEDDDETAPAQDDGDNGGPLLEIDKVGLTLAVGVGYGMPFGDSYKAPSTSDDTGLGSGIAAQIPVALSLGVRPIPYLSFGMAFQYAPMWTKNCDSGSTCSASDTYVGLELRLHLVPDQAFCPWISVGVGYEWLSASETGAVTNEGSLRGRDYDIELGADIRVTRALAVGPYVGVRFGNYGDISNSNYSSGNDSVPDGEQATHGWWVLGVRGAFTISRL